MSTRRFFYNGAELEDPNPAQKPDEVRRVYAAVYPALTNASVVGPTEKNGEQHYEFKASVATKG